MKNDGLVKLIYQSCVWCPGMSGHEFSVATVNLTVKYELFRSECSCTAVKCCLYAVVKEKTNEGWDAWLHDDSLSSICDVFSCLLGIG